VNDSVKTFLSSIHFFEGHYPRYKSSKEKHLSLRPTHEILG